MNNYLSLEPFYDFVKNDNKAEMLHAKNDDRLGKKITEILKNYDIPNKNGFIIWLEVKKNNKAQIKYIGTGCTLDERIAENIREDRLIFWLREHSINIDELKIKYCSHYKKESYLLKAKKKGTNYLMWIEYKDANSKISGHLINYFKPIANRPVNNPDPTYSEIGLELHEKITKSIEYILKSEFKK